MKISALSFFTLVLASVSYAIPTPSPTATQSTTGTITDLSIPATFTATRKYFTLTEHAPYMVERTTVVTWTVTALPSSTGA